MLLVDDVVDRSYRIDSEYTTGAPITYHFGHVVSNWVDLGSGNIKPVEVHMDYVVQLYIRITGHLCQ